MACCPARHPLKVGFGRNDGRLTCDGPCQTCCGGEGILEPGTKRLSCICCDYDICPECVQLLAQDAAPVAAGEEGSAGPLRGLTDETKAENFEAAWNRQELNEAMLGEDGSGRRSTKLGRNGRDIAKPKLKPKAAPAPELTPAELEAREAAAAAAAAALLAEEAAPTTPKRKGGKAAKPAAPAAAPAAPADPEACERSDAALREAVALGELEALKLALAAHAETASEAAAAEARKARDKLKEKAKKAAKKEKKQEKLAKAEPDSPQSVTAEWVVV